jgi:cardiolipin synthase
LPAGAWLIAGLLAACAVGDGRDPPALPPAPDGAPLRVHDERGSLDPRRAAAVVRKLDGDAGLLALHLREVESAISEPLTVGNDADLLIDGPQTEAAMLRAVAAARYSIELETYILEPAGMGERLAKLLESKRAAGVRARVLYDSVGSLPTPAAFFDRLRAARIEVCEFNPVSPTRLQQDAGLSINNRDHRKLLIVDNQVAFTGGINISGVYSSSSFSRKNKSADRQTGWRDTQVVVRGPVAGQFRALFDAMWRSQHCAEENGPQAPPLAGREPEARRVGTMAVRLVAADPLSQRSELYVALLSAVDQARQRIWLTYGYFAPDERMLRALQDAARRGVDVRMMLPGFSDFWAPFHAGRSHYSALLAAGVRLFERRDALLHAKTAVIDGVWSSVGSTNLDWRSFVHNYEADLLVLDARFAGEMENLFRLDVSAAHEVVASEWGQRGIGNRILEWLARRWDYFL